MKKLLKLHFAFALIAILFASCSDDDPTPEYPSLKGVFVVSEGGFNKNNGGIGFYGETTKDSDIFKSINKRVLGDIVQDFEIVDTLGFVVVNNSQKVEVVRMRDFKSVEIIDDVQLTYPRFVVQASDNTVYISNGSTDGEILIYDFKKFELTGKIAVGQGPEMMVKVGNKMYVANSGGFGVDKTISVIDIATSKVVKTITVDEGTVTLKIDNNNNVWAYSKGSGGSTWVFSASKLYMINSNTDEIEKTFSITTTLGTYGSNLFAISKDGFLYYMSDAIYKMSIDSKELPTEKWMDKTYYGIEVDPQTGSVYCLDSNTNEVIVVDGKDGSEVMKYTGTGDNPRAIVFNK